MKDKFIEWCKTPVGTAIFIGIFILLIIVYVFSQTSIGRKALKFLKTKLNDLIDSFQKHKEEVEKKLEKNKEELESELETELGCLRHNLELATQLLIEIGNTINNKKVKALVQKFESEKLSHEREADR